MFLRIGNTPRPYEWGSRTAIAQLLGTTPSGGPEAELWLGAHRGSPSVIIEPEKASGARDLAEWIDLDPKRALGEAETLPFLLKVLAADTPLSLQAHPTLERAREGFARENAKGIPLDARDRNYRDPLHKPEAVVAVSERFDALCGFRPIDQTRAIIGLLIDADAGSPVPEVEVITPLRDLLDGDASVGLHAAMQWLLGGGPAVEALVSLVSRLAKEGAGVGSPYTESFSTVVDLALAYPGDPGVVISLMLNRVTLRRGEALYLPAGNIHAYLSGLAIEVMAASDNVLRGGLTPKHVDIRELLAVLDFEPVPPPRLTPQEPEPGIEVFRPDLPDFVLVHVDTRSGARPSFRPGAPTIALCLDGRVELTGGRSAIQLSRGESVFVTADEETIRFEGSGELYLAAQGGPLGDR